MIKQIGKAQYKKVKQVIKQNKTQHQCMKVEQNIVLNIIKRELAKGTFDKTCTEDERMELRRFIFHMSKEYRE